MLKEEEQLRVILNAYLADVVEERGEYGEFQAAIVGDPSLVIAYLLEHPSLMLIRPCNHSYPERHRVCDIEVDGKYYRILRCVTCSERLAFEQIREESACTSVLGLPLWLTGEHLRRWVANEKKLQTQMSEHLEGV